MGPIQPKLGHQREQTCIPSSDESCDGHGSSDHHPFGAPKGPQDQDREYGTDGDPGPVTGDGIWKGIGKGIGKVGQLGKHAEIVEYRLARTR